MTSRDEVRQDADLPARVAAAVRVARTKRGLTAAQLSDRTAQFGKTISRAVISDLETGRKKTLDVAELISLSAALDTSPAVLLFGDQLADGEVELLPGLKMTAIAALQWFSGIEPMVEGVDGGRYREANRPASQARKIEEVRQFARAAAIEFRDTRDIDLLQEAVRSKIAAEIEARDAGLIVVDDG
ncbi:helix-turn-helix transcriptional regulator [Tsukamurella asaccharolytica]|uniref:Helix-turn-helix transcriptional regulator n=1 Tax=Tsukamurella asaccharolytica TaxID=2592067 RepID=A0A5C5REW1_9ACTN|nr:helix-turn-helix transcriptional regulator [Tsukamurella asaccharolytica]TWS20631.1 helix-turn-helix transcriptional regulator [Tsukamurella asaccharolytica]